MGICSTENGITIYFKQMPHAESVAIDLFIKVGSRYENPDNSGITHLLEHMHFRHLEGLSQEEIYFAFESLGASLNATTYKEALCFSVKTRPVNTAKIIDLFTKIIVTFDWTEEDLLLERAVILREIQEREYYSCIVRYVDWQLWKNNPFCLPTLGDSESVSRITLEDITTYKKRSFCQGNMFFLMSGKISDDDIKHCQEKLSNLAISKRDRLEAGVLPPKKIIPNVKLLKTEESPLDVYITFENRYDTVSREALVLLTSVVGGGDGSALQRIIREKLGLSYSIFAEATTFEDTAILQIKCKISKKELLLGLDTIFEILNQVKRSISTQDIAINMPFFTDNLNFWLENPSVYNANVAWELLYGNLDDFDIQGKADKYSNITPDMLTKSARSLFRSENTCILIAGNIGRLTKKEILAITQKLE
jgi:predicted Zn-dependent peptidase